MSDVHREHMALLIVYQFYSELATWIEAGTPEHEIFNKSVATCATFFRWTRKLRHRTMREDCPRWLQDAWWALEYGDPDRVTLVCEQNNKALNQYVGGRISDYPFNDPLRDRADAMDEHDAGSSYKNEKRVAWVRHMQERGRTVLHDLVLNY